MSTELALGAQPTMLETVMRAVSDPNVDPARLEHFLKIGRELQQDQAKAQFNAAFAALKLELPVISKRGVVLNKAKTEVMYKYARYDDLHEAITPLLSRFGFATSFDFAEPEAGRLQVTLKLKHVGGHEEMYHWTLPAMGQNQFVSNLQNAAAARSFGKRCVLIDALDVLTRDQDSDGHPVEPVEKLTEDLAARIEDMLSAVEEREPGAKARFAKWIKSEFQADKVGALFQGGQLDAVMARLREKMRELGIK
jgi:ERF superfamily